jgi:hypothetical protein
MAADNGAGDAKKITYGKVFDNGEALELVAPSLSENLRLLHWSGNDLRIGLRFRVGEVVYQAPRLHRNLLTAVQFPSTAREYGNAEKLLGAIASLIRQATGLDEAAATGAALWVRSSWFADFSSNPPLLHLTGPERLVVRLLRTLQSLCRHSLTVTDLTRNLPFYLQPTLIAYDPTLSTKRQAWWRASNHVGVFVPQKGGTFRNFACAKAVYAGDQEDSPDAWGPDALRLDLLPTLQPLPEWSESEEQQLAALYQPQLLMFRLQNFPRVQQAMSAPRGTAVNSELARNLLASGPDAPEIIDAVTPWFVAYEDELSARRSTDVKAILVEELWTPSHESQQIAISDLTKRVNNSLRHRGERNFYSEKEVGWKLRQMRIPRHRNGKGMVVKFSSEVRRRVHFFVREFGLNLPRNENCPDCKGLQADVVQEDV